MTGASCDPHERCITCGDEGIPMRVNEVTDGIAICADESDATHTVAIELVEPVAIGDELLVHAGVAIGRLDEARSAA